MESIAHKDNDESFTTVAFLETKGNCVGFANALSIWINKPHVVKRNLCGAKLHLFEVIDKENEANFICNLTSKIALSSKFCVQDCCSGQVNEDSPRANVNENIGEAVGLCEVENLSDLDDTQIAVIVRDVIPKHTNRLPVTREIITYDHLKKTLTVFPQIDITAEGSSTEKDYCHCRSKELPYQFVFVDASGGLNSNNSIIELRMKKKEEGTGDYDKFLSTCDWLKTTLLPKISAWSCEPQLKTSVTSLRLVLIDKYNHLYHQLKEKYGKKFVEIWPESTDPQKFVYEDVAIATYLLLIWQQERNDKKIRDKQSFVDLGCGNGLLVHILSSEGHPGIGLDVRKRNIWDLYGQDTILKEETVTPSAENTFPEYDWLIGNHSDELTPWIPVMAARSSYNCRYFVLPCCHFDFDKKFDKRESGVSNYRSYLNFVQEVGQVCGFNVEEDTLRIPSTKRVCFVGKTRNYSVENEDCIDKLRTEYIKHRCDNSDNKETLQNLKSLKSDSKGIHNQTSEIASDGHPNDCGISAKKAKLVDSDTGQWSSTFKPRDGVEGRTRNCQHLPKELKEFIIKTVFNHVLEADKEEIRELPNGKKWRKGGCVPLPKVVELFDRDILKELKSECGGLQTLLRNHNSVFNGGNVQLRDLTLADPYSGRSKLKNKDRSEYFKTIRCWFNENHPDGCPRTSETCTFAHGESDLKNKVVCVKTS